VKFVFEDDDTGELIVRDLTPEQIEMLQGFYDLPDDAE
jgi:hypothetical protein